MSDYSSHHYILLSIITSLYNNPVIPQKQTKKSCGHSRSRSFGCGTENQIC